FRLFLNSPLDLFHGHTLQRFAPLPQILQRVPRNRPQNQLFVPLQNQELLAIPRADSAAELEPTSPGQLSPPAGPELHILKYRQRLGPSGAPSLSGAVGTSGLLHSGR
ncbi:MAG: hypothetical protein JXA14_07615, partial [Anaerolineae bacterium]|nr:hypothetical protein [Anaerolineae bacterium]